MKFLCIAFLLGLAPSTVLADSYNNYIIDQSARLKNQVASVEDLFGSPRLEALANAGDIRAQYELGMLRHSVGDESGVKWLEKAANQGNVRAQYLLGALYIEGKFVERDLKKSFELMDKCSRLGNPDCSFYVGVFYEEGFGIVKQNTALAHWYLSEAAAQGVKKAIDRLCKGKEKCEYN